MIKKITNGLKYWGQLLLLPVYGLSFLVPRDKNLWLFGSTFGRRFADNPKYLYLYTSQNSNKISRTLQENLEKTSEIAHTMKDIICKDIRAVWISHNKDIVNELCDNGYEAYYYHSFKGIIIALRAGVYIFDNYSKDINFWQSGRALKLNLWHGVGNKRINYDNEFDTVRHPKNKWEKFKSFPRRLSDEKPSHYILATSDTMAKIFARAFQVSDSHIVLAGYPRNDIIVGNDIVNILSDEEKAIIQKIETYKLQHIKIDFYMPTFRESEKRFLEIMDLERFNEFLKNNNIVFFTKLHPKSKLKEAFGALEYSNIVNISADADPYVFMKYVDVLTTDYSSIYSDFMLLNRPVVAFQYDYMEYEENTRKGYFDFDKYMPERKAENMQELMNVTKEVLDLDTCMKARSESRKILFKSKKPDACHTIVKWINNHVQSI